MATNKPSKYFHAGVINGRWHVPNLTIKAQVAVEGDVLDKESVSINEESGMLLVILFRVCLFMCFIIAFAYSSFFLY